MKNYKELVFERRDIEKNRIFAFFMMAFPFLVPVVLLSREKRDSVFLRYYANQCVIQYLYSILLILILSMYMITFVLVPVVLIMSFISYIILAMGIKEGEPRIVPFIGDKITIIKLYRIDPEEF